MDEGSYSSGDNGPGPMTRIAAWILLALALGGIFCWRVATTA